MSKNKNRARRVNYRINYCSSQDPEYPVSQLVLQSAQSKGWITKRFAPFPQTLVLQLLQLTVVQSLAFLSHQNKICTRIDIQGKQDHESNWIKVGYTTLESGVNTNYQSRELRNVTVGGRLLSLLKFTFQQNYSNHINIFNQVGLIALLVYGEKATVEREWVKGKQGNVVASLNQLDRETIMKLKNLEQIKRDAVEDQRFQDAKAIRYDIQGLHQNIPALIILEKDKKQAIKREDFDQAKDIVERMKKLRGPMVFHKSNPLSANNSIELAKSKVYSPKKRLPKSALGEFDDRESEERNENDYYKLPERRSEPRSRKGFDLNVGTPRRNQSMVVPFDEVKIEGKDRYPLERQLERDKQGGYQGFSRKKPLPPKKPKNKSPIHKNPEEQDDQMLNPRQLPSLKKVDKLTPDQLHECSKFFPTFNQSTFEYLFSRDHTFRQKGVNLINNILNEFNTENRRQLDQFATASVLIVKNMIDDRIMSVLTGVVDYFGMMMKKIRPGLIGPASKNIKYILQKMADYLGHNNQNFRQTVQDVYASLPSHKLTNRQLCFQVLMNNPRERVSRIVAGRLSMLERIIDKYHLSQEVDDLIDFGKRYLEDKSSEVRMAAVGLMAMLSREMGYQNLYDDLKGLKPQVIRMIEERIEANGGVIQKIEIKRNNSNNSINNSIKKIVNNNYKQPEQPKNPEYYCQYCKVFDKRLENDNYRDQHLYSDCKMITLCPECQQAIEVSSLNTHLLAQCPNHKYYKRCPKCREAIPSKEYNNHTRMKECIASKALAQANRCPFCHEDTEPGEKGWVKHLVTEGCPNNPKG